MSPSGGLQTFQCERQRMRLTHGACAKLFASTLAKPPAPWEGRQKCVGCPIGATNAGKTINYVALAAAAIADLCPRCGQTGARIIAGNLCVSCYNRGLEARRGRNAKGTRPRLCSALHSQIVAVAIAGQSSARVWTRQQVTGRAEVLLQLAKGAKAPMSFGVPPPLLQPQGWQLELSL